MSVKITVQSKEKESREFKSWKPLRGQNIIVLNGISGQEDVSKKVMALNPSSHKGFFSYHIFVKMYCQDQVEVESEHFKSAE